MFVLLIGNANPAACAKLLMLSTVGSKKKRKGMFDQPIGVHQIR